MKCEEREKDFKCAFIIQQCGGLWRWLVHYLMHHGGGRVPYEVSEGEVVVMKMMIEENPIQNTSVPETSDLTEIQYTSSYYRLYVKAKIRNQKSEIGIAKQSKV